MSCEEVMIAFLCETRSNPAKGRFMPELHINTTQTETELLFFLFLYIFLPHWHFQVSEAQSNKSDENVTLNYSTPIK